MTASERHALLFFSAVALLGAGVRLHRASGGSSASRAALDAQIAAVDSARGSKGSRESKGPRAVGKVRSPLSALSTPSTPSTPLDLDTAPAESLLRLPRIGPALAGRIVADRDSLGPFGSLDGFQRVRGVGPVTTRTLAPYVTFSGTPRPSPVGARVSTRRREPSREPRSGRAPR
ncbi:MAG: ComEA family DNA-binding protein [Gemmatimonadaceae bacterium]